MIDAIAAGHLCVDIIPTIDQVAASSESFLAPGRLTEVGPAVLSTGGAVSNTGLALHRLGVDVRLVARVGDDQIADLTRNLLQRHGPHLADTLGVGVGEPSSYSVVINPPGVDRTFLHCTGTNDTFGPEDVDPDLVSQARLFHFGYPPLMRRMYADGGITLAETLRTAHQAGATISLDMAMPDPAKPSGQADWPGILVRALPYVQLFVPSVEELLYMLRRPRYDELARTVGQAVMLDEITAAEVSSLARAAITLGARVVLLKMGHRGLYVRTAADLGDMGRAAPTDLANWSGRELWAPCFHVTVRGTVGAGDATIAGFLAGLLKGETIEGALTAGVAVGACCVETPDATSGIRPWLATQARVTTGWDRLPGGPDDQGWLQQGDLWYGPDDHAH